MCNEKNRAGGEENESKHGSYDIMYNGTRNELLSGGDGGGDDGGEMQHPVIVWLPRKNGREPDGKDILLQW